MTNMTVEYGKPRGGKPRGGKPRGGKQFINLIQTYFKLFA